MILISVGTHNQPFDRLLREVDRLAEKEEIKDKIIAQIGYSSYKPRNYRYFKFTSWNRILDLNKKADVVITHGGAGNLLIASYFNKQIVAVPRMKRYGEHLNDHQIQLVKELEKQGRVLAVYNITNLGQAIRKAKKKIKVNALKKKDEKKERKIISIVERYVEKISKEKNTKKQDEGV